MHTSQGDLSSLYCSATLWKIHSSAASKAIILLRIFCKCKAVLNCQYRDKIGHHQRRKQSKRSLQNIIHRLQSDVSHRKKRPSGASRLQIQVPLLGGTVLQVEPQLHLCAWPPHRLHETSKIWNDVVVFIKLPIKMTQIPNTLRS